MEAMSEFTMNSITRICLSEFKAQPPVGDLRFRAPVSSNGTQRSQELGKQYKRSTAFFTDVVEQAPRRLRSISFTGMEFCNI